MCQIAFQCPANLLANFGGNFVKLLGSSLPRDLRPQVIVGTSVVCLFVYLGCPLKILFQLSGVSKQVITLLKNKKFMQEN